MRLERQDQAGILYIDTDRNNAMAIAARTGYTVVHAYIADWNTHLTPFVWTKDPSAIVKKALGRGR